jgi:hypothetical protein
MCGRDLPNNTNTKCPDCAQSAFATNISVTGNTIVPTTELY